LNANSPKIQGLTATKNQKKTLSSSLVNQKHPKRKNFLGIRNAKILTSRISNSKIRRINFCLKSQAPCKLKCSKFSSAIIATSTSTT
jgi:hypothetical protein